MVKKIKKLLFCFTCVGILMLLGCGKKGDPTYFKNQRILKNGHYLLQNEW